MEESGCHLLSIKDLELFFFTYFQLEVGGNWKIVQSHHWPPQLQKRKKKLQADPIAQTPVKVLSAQQ